MTDDNTRDQSPDAADSSSPAQGDAPAEASPPDGPAEISDESPVSEGGGGAREELPSEVEVVGDEAVQFGIGLVEDPPSSPVPGEGVVSGEVALESAQERLEGLLTRLADLARREGMRTLAAEVTGERLPALREGRVTAVILGEFNHGKSTILNALLGRNVLPMGITPTTSVITHLRHGEKAEAIVHYDDHDRKTVPIEELPQVVGADQTLDPRYVEVFFPSEVLKDNLVLVDTPGVNDISRQRVEITYGYLPRADVIIYVLDANQVLKRSEITFIRDRLLRANRDRLIFVLGKIDALDDEEREEVETYAREKLGEFLDSPDLYPVSARRELAEGDPGFAAFRARLLAFLRDRKAYILIDSGVSGGLRVGGMLTQNLAIKRRGYALDRAELQRRVEAVRARLRSARAAIYENVDRIDETTRGMKATARHNLRQFTNRFAEALPREIERAGVDDIRKFLGDWIRDTYKEWLELEGNAMARELERLAEEVIETTNANLREAVDDMQDELDLGGELVELDIDTMTYDVGVYALGTVGLSIALLGGVFVGGLVMLAAPLLAVVVRDRVEERTREMARNEGVRAVKEAGANVEAETVRVIEDYGEKLKRFVEHAGDRLYQQIDETLQQVSRDTSDGDIDRKDLDARAEAALKDADDIMVGLKLLRDELA